MLDTEASSQSVLVDVFVESVEEARMYTKVLLSSAASDFQKFASQAVTCPRTGRSFSGRVVYGERSYHSDASPRPVVGQYLLIGAAAMGEVRALQTLAMIRDELRAFFTLSAPSRALEIQEADGFKVTLKNGSLTVTLERSHGETMLAVIS
ncbi:hypothetical protein KZ843_09165 [Pseudomonas aeruginosa]|nr:hypothetical protein [Pseudomonas aeruginosa]MBW6123052.1 hypothetical protein [Pseudomonas aeruginosa]